MRETSYFKQQTDDEKSDTRISPAKISPSRLNQEISISIQHPGEEGPHAQSQKYPENRKLQTNFQADPQFTAMKQRVPLGPPGQQAESRDLKLLKSETASVSRSSKTKEGI